jgi:molecular chaperone GrpE
MDSNNEIKENFSEEMDLKSSIEDFLRELEEKEKDLNMSDEMVIEIEEDSSEQELSEFLETELSVVNDSTGEVQNIQFSSEPVRTAQTPEQTNQIADLENKVGELKKALLRRQMDFDNYRKRIERERGDSFQNQIGNLATQMLPVLDNLNRALDAALHFDGEQSKDFRQFFDGIALVNQQLNEVLCEMGVQPVLTVGEAFNPYFHDAVATEATDDFPPNTITEELLRGYRIGEKLIRAAMVKVAAPTE